MPIVAPPSDARRVVAHVGVAPVLGDAEGRVERSAFVDAPDEAPHEVREQRVIDEEF